MRWQRFAEIKSQLPEDYATWAGLPGSFTARMREATQGKITNHLLYQNWEASLSDEAEPLGPTSGAKIYAREVYFSLQDEPWLWARTLFTEGVMAKTKQKFAGIGDRPLGELLFQDPELQESPHEFSCLPLTHRYCVKIRSILPSLQQPLWARRTLFKYEGEHLLVTSVFLPALKL